MPHRDPARLMMPAALAAAAVAFAAGPPLAAEPAPQVVTQPVWVQQPSMHDLMTVYPRYALDTARTGLVVIDCRVATDGALDACAVEPGSRAKYGFGEAGLKLASRFRMDVKDAAGRPTAGAAVRIPIQFKIPDDR